jgi:hypothetical protein
MATWHFHQQGSFHLQRLHPSKRLSTFLLSEDTWIQPESIDSAGMRRLAVWATRRSSPTRTFSPNGGSPTLFCTILTIPKQWWTPAWTPKSSSCGVPWQRRECKLVGGSTTPPRGLPWQQLTAHESTRGILTVPRVYTPRCERRGRTTTFR